MAEILAQREYHILSLGAGVQSTGVYLLAMEGALHLDHAVFADTGDEPQSVYRHLEWLKSLNGPPIIVASKGHKLSERLMASASAYSKLFGKQTRFASVPFFTKLPDGSVGMTRRQCSKEYKVEVVERCIRRTLLGLQPRQRIPKTIKVTQYFGISVDEIRRTVGIKKRCKDPKFPLIELDWTRVDCQRWLESRVPHEVPKSACVYCPFHNNQGWLNVKAVPEDWALALRVDAALREPDKIVNRNMDAMMYAHRSCVPLDQVVFKNERQMEMFVLECESGICGV